MNYCAYEQSCAITIRRDSTRMVTWLAASAAEMPCRVSACVPPSNGVVIAKREFAPSSAFVSAAVSSSDARTSVTTRVCKLPRLRGVGTARDGANLVPALEQALHHSAILFARASRDDDGKLLIHDPPPFTCDNDRSDFEAADADRGCRGKAVGADR